MTKFLDRVQGERTKSVYGISSDSILFKKSRDIFGSIKSNFTSKPLGQVKLMFPMISGVGELIRAKEFLFTAKRQLRESGQDFDEDILVGCMIETPAAVTICDLIADEVTMLERMIWFNIYWPWIG